MILLGIFTSWITFFVSIFLFEIFWFFFSLSLARLTDAKLLSFPSKDSWSNAFDNVSLPSLLVEKLLLLDKLVFFD